MSDRSQDELRKRFNRSQTQDDTEGAETSDSSDSSVTSDPSQTNEIDEMDEMEETSGDDSSGTGLKERKQVAMYLSADLRSDLQDLHDELDARSKLAGDGELEKNREFYEGLVEFALDRKVEFAETLGIEIDTTE